jgi:N-glycosylase/DNA lyase
MAPEFRWAEVPASVLDIPLTLASGQVFGWTQAPDGLWYGAIGSLAVALRPEDDGFGWATWPPDGWGIVERFLNLSVDLERLYGEWVRADSGFADLIEQFPGLRVLHQDPSETLVAFICSSCNNVPRITGMLHRLAALVSAPLSNPWGVTIHANPTVAHMAHVSEAALRTAGFGYRARFLAMLGSMSPLLHASFFDGLRSAPWDTARQRLMELPGVGPKVADCVGLFGLGHHDVVPVDTHVRRYVVERLVPDLKGRSLTEATYCSLAAAFRGIMGSYAGWAQQYVFMAARTRRQTAASQGGKDSCSASTTR